MINKIGKITIYVNNQEEAKNFWCNQLDFVVAFEKQMGPNMKWLEVAPKNGAETTFVLYEKQLMLAQNKDANVAHPSIILSTDHLEEAHEKMKAKGVEVTDIMSMPYGSMFSFKDNDGNSYLLREDK